MASATDSHRYYHAGWLRVSFWVGVVASLASAALHLADTTWWSNLIGLGQEPNWVRLAVVSARASETPGEVSHSIARSSSGVACWGRGIIPWEEIELDAISLTVGATRSRFVRGNCNGLDGIDLADAIRNLNFQFAGQSVDCQAACDANGVEGVSLGDPIHILNFLFLGGPQPPGNFPACDEAPIEDCAEDICNT